MREKTKVLLSTLHPIAKELGEKLLTEVSFPGTTEEAKAGLLSFEITLAWRSKEEQEALYQKGRTVPGPKVTNAHWYESYHSFVPSGLACAMDLGVYNAQTKEFTWPNPNSIDPKEKDEATLIWGSLAEAAEAYGFQSGFRWKNKDSCHLQLNLGPNFNLKAFTDFIQGLPEQTVSKLITQLWKACNPQVIHRLSTEIL